MMASLLVVARTAPAREDGVQLGGVKRPRVLTVRIAREPSETSGAIKEPRPRQAATRLADGQRGDERAVRRRVLRAPGLSSPMDGMRWQYLKSVRQLLVGNEDSALRDAFEKCTHPCMRRHRLVLSESPAFSAAKVTRLASRLLVSKYPPALTRVPRDATAMVLIFFSCDVTAAGTATGSTSISLYQPTTEDVAGWSAAKGALEADIAESNIRLGLQRALAKPATSTPEIVANGAMGKSRTKAARPQAG
jgi:hypothetical protein